MNSPGKEKLPESLQDNMEHCHTLESLTSFFSPFLKSEDARLIEEEAWKELRCDWLKHLSVKLQTARYVGHGQKGLQVKMRRSRCPKVAGFSFVCRVVFYFPV